MFSPVRSLAPRAGKSAYRIGSCRSTMSRRQTNPTLGAIDVNINSKRSTTNRRSRRRNTRRRRLTNYPRRMTLRNISRGPDGVLAGYGSPITTVFNERRIDDGLIVRGMDLVTSFSFGDNISYFITANPAAWNGTRVAAIAAGFQNYRPLKFVIHYRPQVGSTSDISMFIGTIWQNNYITARSQIEPSLLTSPGGVYTPAWQSASTQVNLGRCLPQRMYPIRDPHFTTIPFAVVARAADGGPTSEAVEMPGRIFIEYAYEFRNAIGSGSGFQPSNVTEITASVPAGDTTMRTNFQNEVRSGWIVDYQNTAALDVEAPSTTLPLFASYAVDANGTTQRQISINGVIPTVLNSGAATAINASIFVYSDNGLPA